MNSRDLYSSWLFEGCYLKETKLPLICRLLPFSHLSVTLSEKYTRNSSALEEAELNSIQFVEEQLGSGT